MQHLVLPLRPQYLESSGHVLTASIAASSPKSFHEHLILMLHVEATARGPRVGQLSTQAFCARFLCVLGFWTASMNACCNPADCASPHCLARLARAASLRAGQALFEKHRPACEREREALGCSSVRTSLTTGCAYCITGLLQTWQAISQSCKPTSQIENATHALQKAL